MTWKLSIIENVNYSNLLEWIKRMKDHFSPKKVNQIMARKKG